MTERACLFCKIATKEIEASLVYEDEVVLAFRDINPQAPTHVLVIPKKHIDSLDQATPADEPLLGHLLYVAKTVAQKERLISGGFRVVANTGANAGQTVFHLHVHLMGGRSFHWPPG